MKLSDKQYDDKIDWELDLILVEIYMRSGYNKGLSCEICLKLMNFSP